MKKPTKPKAPNLPNYLSEEKKQTFVLYEETSSYLDFNSDIRTLIDNVAKKQHILKESFDLSTIRFSCQTDADYDGHYTNLSITIDAEITESQLEQIKGHNKTLKIEYDASCARYAEKVIQYEKDMNVWQQSDAGLKFQKRDSLKKVNKLIASKIADLTEKFNKGLITQKELTEKISKL